MKPSSASPLLVRPSRQEGETLRVTPASAGWQDLHFSAHRLLRGQSWEVDTEGFEYGIVILGGIASIESSLGSWPRIGRRPNVFSGLPHALYLPPGVRAQVQAVSATLDFACGWCAARSEFPPSLVTPDRVAIEIRGGGNATRQINSIFPPGYACQRLVAVEVYTPSGNWSSYPPHKHDVHRTDANGALLEADLEETYYYKFDRPEGYAIQRVYTGDRRLDEAIVARDGDVVLVPEGYHPVASAHGYTTYYLNFLAGSAQSLANADDPEHAWIKSTWIDKDPRVPVVTLAMESNPPA